MGKRITGIFFILLSLLVWVTDRLTHFISTQLGKIICEDHPMHTVDGMLGDSSCGFNIDMHLSYSLFTVLISGVIFYISSRKAIV